MYRLSNELCPKPILNLFKMKVAKYETRTSGVHSRTFTDSKCNKSFLCKPVFDWQCLPGVVKESNNLKSCVRQVKLHLFKSY